MPTRPELVRALDDLDFPDGITERDIARAARDALILGDRLTTHPGSMRSLLSGVLTGDSSDAQAVLEELQLREADFLRDGGGFLWLVVVVVLLVATNAY